MVPEIPDDAKVRSIKDHNGNVCGYLFARYELPWPLIRRIDDGLHREVVREDISYHTKPIND